MTGEDRARSWREAATRQAGADYARRYAERFAELAASGANVHGEAALVDQLVPPGSRVLDAGCGTGRVAARLADLGHQVVGADVDAAMIGVAREQRPELTWVVADLAALALPTRFGAVVMAGNVVPFVTAPLLDLLGSLGRHLEPGGLLVCGYGLDRAHLPPGAGVVPLAAYDDAAATAGLELADRFSGWDGAAYDGGGYAVTVHRRRRTPAR